VLFDLHATEYKLKKYPFSKDTKRIQENAKKRGGNHVLCVFSQNRRLPTGNLLTAGSFMDFSKKRLTREFCAFIFTMHSSHHIGSNPVASSFP
jgi:hypothetical protein